MANKGAIGGNMVLGSELECLSRKKRGRRLGRGRDPGCWDYDGDYGEVVYEDRGCREIEMEQK